MLLGMVMGLLIAMQSVPPRADTRTWYQAYQDGVRQIQQRNWQAAIASLNAAKRSGPKPGRRIPFYGDVYEDFLPDYYLGIAYVNAQQYKEAASAFDAVRQTGLITAKDKEYAEFTRQSASAAAQVTSATVAQAPPAQGTPPPIAPTTQTSQPSPVTQPANADVGTAVAANVDTPPPVATARPDPPPPAAAAPGGSARPPAAPTTRLPAPRPTGSPKQPSQAPVDLGSEPAAMAAFFAGDYLRAANILSGLIARGASPRAAYYLACSRAALVLTGGADATTLAEARAQFATVSAAQFTADERYISPRVLALLRNESR